MMVMSGVGGGNSYANSNFSSYASTKISDMSIENSNLYIKEKLGGSPVTGQTWPKLILKYHI